MTITLPDDIYREIMEGLKEAEEENKARQEKEEVGK